MRRRFALRMLVLLVATAGMTAERAQPRAAAEEQPTRETSLGETLSARDVDAIRAVVEAYRSAWLRGDARGVLDTFTPEAVLLPAHGASPVIGTAAITKYWWPPDAPPATITKLDITAEDVEGDSRFASVYGRDDVEWTQVENGVATKHGHPGTYLNVMRKLPDGSWRISIHMWDDAASR